MDRLGTASGTFRGVPVPSDSLSVVFQPIIRFDSGVEFAKEALVRCTVPEYENPTQLFAHASLAGCAGLLGRLIREVALAVAGETPVFVNLHPSELADSWLVRPDDPIYGHGRDVYLEITESATFQNFDHCHGVLREISSRAGIHVVVDDFGAGYSNLARIADIEPRIVKLDRELVKDIHLKPRKQRLVASVTRLCGDMGAEVVAEGIELSEEYRVVRDCGVHYGQGYLFSRPEFPSPVSVFPPPDQGDASGS
jgi:EAL domain-containing protein (putative c-di-GMP-specific phosphodiesterase class I)